MNTRRITREWQRRQNVDGLGTWQPEDATMYASMGEHLATHGYLAPSIKV